MTDTGVDRASGPDYSVITYPRLPKVPGNAEARKAIANGLRHFLRERRRLEEAKRTIIRSAFKESYNL